MSRSIALVFGGANSEHQISVASARGVADALDGEVRLLGIDRRGVWHRVDAVDELDTLGSSAARPGPRDSHLDGVDVAFPLVHGRGGEDGALQGVLELAGIPYVGCGVLASAIAMDKGMTARLLAAAGVPVIETRTVSAIEEAEALCDRPRFPVFVKPNRAGSSVGAARVDTPDGLVTAVADALAHDDTALIQPLVVADEVSIGVLKTVRDGLRTTGPSLLRLSAAEDFFSYAGKYGGGDTRLEIPAELSPSVVEELRELAALSFRILGGEGLARIDFFVHPDGGIAVNEINTLPGFGPQSHYPRLWRAAGIDYPELLGQLIDSACAIGPRLSGALRAGTRPGGG